MSDTASPDLSDWKVRPATLADHFVLSKLIHFETHVHRHLDWQAPIDFVGDRNFLIAEKDGDLLTALACPMDLPGIAWLRLFVSVNQVDHVNAWNLLWNPVRSMLSESLQAVVSQTMLKRSTGGRVAEHEIMRGTSAIRNLIREDKVAQMYSAVQTGSAVGMQTMDQCLEDLVSKRLITREVAREKARMPENF